MDSRILIRSFLFSFIALIVSNAYASNIPILAEKAPKAAAYLDRLEQVARRKNYTFRMEENTYIYKNVAKDLTNRGVTCVDFKKKSQGKRLFKTYLTVLSIEMGIRSRVPESTVNNFLVMFNSGPFSAKTMICDEPLMDGRQVIFISGDRKYSLDLKFFN